MILPPSLCVIILRRIGGSTLQPDRRGRQPGHPIRYRLGIPRHIRDRTDRDRAFVQRPVLALISRQRALRLPRPHPHATRTAAVLGFILWDLCAGVNVRGGVQAGVLCRYDDGAVHGAVGVCPFYGGITSVEIEGRSITASCDVILIARARRGCDDPVGEAWVYAIGVLGVDHRETVRVLVLIWNLPAIDQAVCLRIEDFGDVFVVATGLA